MLDMFNENTRNDWLLPTDLVSLDRLLPSAQRRGNGAGLLGASSPTEDTQRPTLAFPRMEGVTIH